MLILGFANKRVKVEIMIFMMCCYICPNALVSQVVLKGKVKIKGTFSAPFVHCAQSFSHVKQSCRGQESQE